MKARVKLVCPICEVDLSCIVIDRNEHPKNWVLSVQSIKHLDDKTCTKKSKVSEEIAVAA